MTKLNVKERLTGTKYASKADKLAAEFSKAGIDTVEKLHNAPVLVRTTHGADIYELIEQLAKPVKSKKPVKEANYGNKAKD